MGKVKMNNPIMNFQSFMNGFRQLAANPAQYLMNQYGIPKEIAGNPDEIIKRMMNEGKITQEQYNQARSMAYQIQQNPMFNAFFK